MSFQNSLTGYFVSDDFFLIYPYSWKEVLLTFGGEGLANDRDRERPILGTPSIDEHGNPIIFNEIYYRPLVRLSAFLDQQIWGFNSFGYHLTNLLLHLATTLIIYLWVKDLLVLGRWKLKEEGKGRIALIVGLLFVTHPVHVEAVTWLSGRVDILCSFFYLSSLLFFTRYLLEIREKEGRFFLDNALQSPLRRGFEALQLPLSLGTFVGALMSKEMAITLPLTVFLIDWILGGKPFHSKLRRLFPFIGILVVYLLFRFIVLGGIGGYLSTQGSIHLKFDFFIISILNWYVRQLLLPFEAILPPDIGWVNYLALLLYALPAYPLFRILLLKKLNSLTLSPEKEEEENFSLSVGRVVLIACLWIPVTLLPVMNIAAERFLYLPSVGFVLLLGLGLGIGGNYQGTRGWGSGTHLPSHSLAALFSAFTLNILLVLNIFTTREKNERWYQAGEVVYAVQDQMKALYPTLPQGSHLFFLDLADNYQGAYIYRNGIAGSMRLAYQDYSLRAESLVSVLLINPKAFIKGRHLIFQYQNGTVLHRKDLEDFLSQGKHFPSEIGKTGVEAPVSIIVQSAGLNAGDLGNIFINGQNVSPQGRGYNVVVINSQTGAVEKSEVFDTHRMKGDSYRLGEFIKNLESGKIVILALKDEGALSLTADAVEALRAIGAQDDLRGKLRWSHAVIGVKGAKPGEALELSSAGYVKLEIAGK